MGTAYHPPSSSTEWSTPEEFFKRLDDEFVFTVDLCATEENALCDAFVAKEEDCLSVEWDWVAKLPTRYTGWMNPPWGRGIGKFVQRAYEQSKKHGLRVVCLLPANTDTKWWRDWVWRASEVRFVTGRLHFVCEDGRTGPCPTGACVVVFDPEVSGPPKCVLMERGE
jgi:phage N-6-adenine-methyltransferase